MKKYFISISLIFMAFILASCGDDSNTSSSSSSNKLNIQTKQSTFDEEKNLLDISFLVKNNYNSNIDVTLKDLSIEINPCESKQISITPEEISFSKGVNQQYVTAIVELDGECSPISYKISSSKILKLNNQINTIEYQSEEIDISPPQNDGNSSGFRENRILKFVNTPKPITVDTANQDYNFRVQLVDDKLQSVSEEEVTILTYDIKYGEIEELTVATDQNGFANFTFKSAKNLTNLDENNLSLTIVQGEKRSQISTVVEFNFDVEEVTPHYYQFKNATPIVVKKDSESKNISIDLVNSSNIGVEGKLVEITTIPSQLGSISSSSVLTNSAGRAIFVYTAPESIDEVNGKSTTVTFSFKDEDNAISQTINIWMAKPVDDTIKTEYQFQNSTSINIGKANQNKNISIDLVDGMGIGASDKTVFITNIPTEFGSFSNSKATTDEGGHASFVYTSPKNFDDIDGKSITVSIVFIEEDFSIRQDIVIDFNKSDDIYIPIDYELSLTAEDNDFSMGIPELQKTFAIVLKDRKGDIIQNSDVNFTKIHVQTENSLIAQIYDTINQDSVNELTLKNENNASFIIKSKKLSGIVPLKVTVDFIDINKEERQLSTIINARVMSGSPSAISISYVSTDQDVDRAKYEEKFAISVTDEYGNRVNTRPYVSLGAIVGYTVDGQESSGVETSTSKRLFYGREDIANNNANGVVHTLDDELVDTTNFEDTTEARSEVFKYVNAEGANTDKLVVFGAGKNYEAMGKWDFEKIDNHTLKIQDDYFGEYRSNLYYAVGHNYYQDQCQDDGREWIGSTDSETYQLDEEGTVVVSYKYDYHLTGKDALIWVNLEGYQPYISKDKNDTGEGKNTRIGEVIKHTLRGKGLISTPSEGFVIDKNSSKIVTFQIKHENAPEWYRNANFVNQIKTTKCNINLTTSSNDYDARTCYNNGTGIAYITYSVSAPTDADCTFNIDRVIVSSEFKNINGKP